MKIVLFSSLWPTEQDCHPLDYLYKKDKNESHHCDAEMICKFTLMPLLVSYSHLSPTRSFVVADSINCIEKPSLALQFALSFKSLSDKVLWLWSLMKVLRTGSILAYNENLPRHWLQSYGRSGAALCAQCSNNKMFWNAIVSFSWMCCWLLQILQFFQCFTWCYIDFNVTAYEVRW